MPNNKANYLIKGPKTLLEAAYKEASFLNTDNPCRTPEEGTVGLIITILDTIWFTYSEEDDDVVLTLPKDWDQLMDILDSLKRPKVPEYVKTSMGWTFKVKDHYYQGEHLYVSGWDVYGKETGTHLVSSHTPITEEEFIQGGLRELEEVGFVVGAQVQYTTDEGTLDFTIQELRYSSLTHKTQWHSGLSQVEETAKEFTFCAYGKYNQVPVGQCTLLPKAQTLPTTSQGIPYLRVQHTIHMGIDPVTSLHIGTLKQWKKLGITTLTLPCGTLTQEDLTKLASL